MYESSNATSHLAIGGSRCRFGYGHRRVPRQHIGKLKLIVWSPFRSKSFVSRNLVLQMVCCGLTICGEFKPLLKCKEIKKPPRQLALKNCSNGTTSSGHLPGKTNGVIKKFKQHILNVDKCKTKHQILENEHLQCTLGCKSSNEIRHLCNGLVLSESVYKCIDFPVKDVAKWISQQKRRFPIGLIDIDCVQFSRPNVHQRYALAESKDVIYIVFMGTKVPMDYVANITFWENQVRLYFRRDVKEEHHEAEERLLAHQGFVSRSLDIPIEELFMHAKRRGKRLVLCGHSLGGAVAQLNTLYLLRNIPVSNHERVCCVTFATPALANAALIRLAVREQWNPRIKSYLMPEDPIPNLLLQSGSGYINNQIELNYRNAGTSEVSAFGKHSIYLARLPQSIMARLSGYGKPSFEDTTEEHGHVDSVEGHGVISKHADISQQNRKEHYDGEGHSEKGKIYRWKFKWFHFPFRYLYQFIGNLGSSIVWLASAPVRAVPHYFLLGRQYYLESEGVKGKFTCDSFHTLWFWEMLIRVVNKIKHGHEVFPHTEIREDNDQRKKKTESRNEAIPDDRQRNITVKSESQGEMGEENRRILRIAPFRYHRMRAYRTRILSLVRKIIPRDIFSKSILDFERTDIIVSSSIAPSVSLISAKGILYLDPTSTAAANTSPSSAEARENLSGSDAQMKKPNRTIKMLLTKLLQLLISPIVLSLQERIFSSAKHNPSYLVLHIKGEGLSMVRSISLKCEAINRKWPPKDIDLEIISQPSPYLPRRWDIPLLGSAIGIVQFLIENIISRLAPSAYERHRRDEYHTIVARAYLPKPLTRRIVLTKNEASGYKSMAHSPFLTIRMENDFNTSTVPIFLDALVLSNSPPIS